MGGAGSLISAEVGDGDHPDAGDLETEGQARAELCRLKNEMEEIAPILVAFDSLPESTPGKISETLKGLEMFDMETASFEALKKEVAGIRAVIKSVLEEVAEAEEAARHVQATFRGHSARATRKKAVRAATSLQTQFRGHAVRMEFQKREGCSDKFAMPFRGHLARQQFTHTKTADRRKSEGLKFLNQYKLLELCGEGAFGKVKRAENTDTGAAVAVKILNKRRLKKKRIGRFGNALKEVQKEIAVWKKLRHQNVVPLYEVIDDDDHHKLYLVSEFIPGGSVMPDAKKTEPLQIEDARNVFRQLISALEYLHAQDVVHRDIKPGNILRGTDGSILITDFGVSQEIDDGDDTFRNTVGTAAFMAPEMCTGDSFSGKAVDIWAAGITLYMMLVGETPFSSSKGMQELYERIQNETIALPGCLERPPSLDNLVARVLDKDPLKRATTAEIKEHLWVTADGSEPFAEMPIDHVTVTEEDIDHAITAFKSVAAASLAVLTGKKLMKKLSTKA